MGKPTQVQGVPQFEIDKDTHRVYPPKPIYLEWLDSIGFKMMEWRSIDTILEIGTPVIKTVAYLIAESPTLLFIVDSWSKAEIKGEWDAVHGGFGIPKNSVIKRKFLKV